MKILDPAYDTHQYEPREWQREAIDSTLDALRPTDDLRGIIHAIMGAGKSYVMGALCNAITIEYDETIVVTTVTQKLVTQLVGQIREWVRMETVGQFDGRRKEPDKPIVVTCLPSAPTLARQLGTEGRACPLWLADEAHRTECETIHEAADELEPTHAVGFSATPYRADHDEALSLFSTLLYEYTAQDAMEDGVVVPYRAEHWTGGDAETVDEACIELIERHALDLGPGMVNAPQTNDPEIGSHIDDAEQFVDKCRDAGIFAEAVHSRNDERENRQRIRRLRDGDLDCLVHVNMLSEGVDMPWIRWLCLRRPIASPVRFAQEVGRVLRSHEDKDHALLLDPHDLLGTHTIDAEAILGVGQAKPEAFDEEAADEIIEDTHELLESGEDIPPEVLEELEQMMGPWVGDGGGVVDPTEYEVPVQTLPDTSSFLRKLRLGFTQAGLADPEVTSDHWRDKEPTAAQQRYLNTLIEETSDTIRKTAPDSVRSALRMAWEQYTEGEMERGDVSDWIEVLNAVQDEGRWPDRNLATLEE